VTLDIRKVKEHQFLNDLSYIEINSNLVPYTSAEEYEELVNKAEHSGKRLVETTMGGKLNFTGSYGKNLYEDWHRGDLKQKVFLNRLIRLRPKLPHEKSILSIPSQNSL